MSSSINDLSNDNFLQCALHVLDRAQMKILKEWNLKD